MRKIKQGESVPRTSKVEGDLVIVSHVTEHKSGKYQMLWKFDYTDVTREELMTEAARAHVIDQRRPYKKFDTAKLGEWDNKVFSIREYLDTERRKARPVKKVAGNLWDAMSEQERQEFMEERGLSYTPKNEQETPE